MCEDTCTFLLRKIVVEILCQFLLVLPHTSKRGWSYFLRDISHRMPLCLTSWTAYNWYRQLSLGIRRKNTLHTILHNSKYYTYRKNGLLLYSPSLKAIKLCYPTLTITPDITESNTRKPSNHSTLSSSISMSWTFTIPYPTKNNPSTSTKSINANSPRVRASPNHHHLITKIFQSNQLKVILKKYKNSHKALSLSKLYKLSPLTSRVSIQLRRRKRVSKMMRK